MGIGVSSWELCLGGLIGRSGDSIPLKAIACGVNPEEVKAGKKIYLKTRFSNEEGFGTPPAAEKINIFAGNRTAGVNGLSNLVLTLDTIGQFAI